MTPVAKRRLPSRALEAASASARTRTPTIVGSTRWTYDGVAATSFGCRRCSRTRGVASTTAGSKPVSSRLQIRRRVMGPSMSVSAILVLLAIPGLELAGLQRPPPGLVLAEPRHRRLEGLAEGVLRRPPELSHLLGVDRVAAIVTRPVLHRADQRLRLPGQTQDLPGEDDVLDLMAAADVVDLAVVALAQDQVERRTVVEHV